MLNNVQRSGLMISLDDVAFFPPYAAADMVYCAVMPITSSEFFNAGMLDIRAELKLIIDTECDRLDALRMQHHGTVYSIYRRYKRADGYTELYLSQKAGVR